MVDAAFTQNFSNNAWAALFIAIYSGDITLLGAAMIEDTQGRIEQGR